jgi:phosphoglycolate phosphatase-like HAD superfamily hydrolase
MLAAQRYQHFIFDFDGVICDSLSAAVAAFNEIREEYFPSLPVVSSTKDMTLVYAGSLKTCLSPWLTEAEGRKFFDLHSAAMASCASELQTFNGISSVLSSLGDQSASIVTSAYSTAVRAVLAKDPDFQERCLFRIAGRELRQSKTEKISHILFDLGLAPSQAVYIGDLESDILYCRDVPIDIIAVGYGYHPYEYLLLKNPTHCVASIAELRDLIQPPTATTLIKDMNHETSIGLHRLHK